MCWPSLELPYSAEKKNKKNCMKNMITVVSSRRALLPFLLLCKLVVKSTILAKPEKAGTKYKPLYIGRIAPNLKNLEKWLLGM